MSLSGRQSACSAVVTAQLELVVGHANPSQAFEVLLQLDTIHSARKIALVRLTVQLRLYVELKLMGIAWWRIEDLNCHELSSTVEMIIV